MTKRKLTVAELRLITKPLKKLSTMANKYGIPRITVYKAVEEGRLEIVEIDGVKFTTEEEMKAYRRVDSGTGRPRTW